MRSAVKYHLDLEMRCMKLHNDESTLTWQEIWVSQSFYKDIIGYILLYSGYSLSTYFHRFSLRRRSQRWLMQIEQHWNLAQVDVFDEIVLITRTHAVRSGLSVKCELNRPHLSLVKEKAVWVTSKMNATVGINLQMWAWTLKCGHEPSNVGMKSVNVIILTVLTTTANVVTNTYVYVMRHVRA